MVRIDSDELKQFVTQLFIRLDAPRDTAEKVARSQIEADLSGHHSHGVRLAKSYADWVDEGIIDPKAQPETVHDDDTSAIIDGQTAFGQIVGRKAMAVVNEKAKDEGVAMVGIRNGAHLSRIGEWAERAAADGLAFVGFTCVPAGDQVALPGSAEGRLSTNPVTIGLPSFDALDHPLVLDMATSQVAFGKVKERITAGESVPPEWTTPYEGKPAPEPMKEGGPGALLPLGGQVSGYKGFGLAVMGELLAATMSDSYVSGQPDAPYGNEAVFFVADPLRFSTRDAIQSRITHFREYIQSTEMSPDVDIGIAAGGDELLLPGESEHRQRLDQQRNGVSIAASDVELLNGLAEDLGLEDRIDPHDESN